MNRKKLSVRAARMELEFALVERDPDKIKEAEKELAAALEKAARSSRAAEGKDNRE